MEIGYALREKKKNQKSKTPQAQEKNEKGQAQEEEGITLKRLNSFVLVILSFLYIFSHSGFFEPVLHANEINGAIDKNRLSNSDIRTVSDTLASYMMGAVYDNFGMTEEAVAEYKAALRKNKEIPEIYVKLGADLMLMNRLDEAAEVLNKAAEIDPENTRVHLLLAVIHTARGEYGKAATQHEEALKYEPGNLDTLTFLSELFITQRKFDKAAEVYEKMLRIRDKDAFLYFNLGIIYSKLDLLDKAEEKLKKAIEVDENYLAAQMVLGFIYEEDGKNDKAIERYRKVTELDPANKDAYIRLVQIYNGMKQFDRAKEENDKLFAMDPDSVEPYLNRFSTYLYQEKYREAEQTIKEALAKGLKSASLHASLGYLYSAENDHEQACNEYEKAVRIDSGNDTYKLYLASSLDQAGRKEEVIKVLEKITEGDEGLPEAYNYLGYLYAESGRDLNKAVILIQKALKIDPENGAYLDSLGWAYYKQGNIDGALVEMKKAAENLPNDPVVAEHLGDIYNASGKPLEAAKQWERALKRDPKNELLRAKIETNKK